MILHHALLAWEKWDFWDEVIGHDERNFRWKPDLDLRIEVADKEHPITRGLADFDTTDEGYVLHGKHDGQSTILLTAPQAEIAQRLSLRDGDTSDRIGGRDAAFHARVAKRFAAIAEAEPGRFTVVTALGTAEEVHRRVLEALHLPESIS